MFLKNVWKCKTCCVFLEAFVSYGSWTLRQNGCKIASTPHAKQPKRHIRLKRQDIRMFGFFVVGILMEIGVLVIFGF